MRDLDYQNRAIKDLLEKTIALIDNNTVRQKIVFKAPTGSGKTYMTAVAMEAIADTLRDDSRHEYEKVAFVWIAPNRLHSQAYESLQKLFDETRSLNPIMPSGINDSRLHHGDVLCLNWSSIHQEDNILVKENENGDSLWEILDNTREDKTAIVAIIDEEHLHWDSKADRAKTVLEKMRPIVEIRVSATPKTQSPHTVTILRKDVVAAQMIKEDLVINPDIQVKDSQDVEDYLIDEAVKKRDLLAKCYDEMGKTINPLLLIQLPNDSATISTEDKSVKEQVINYMDTQYAMTVENGELAIWLSDKSDKQNLEGIEKLDSPVKVLIFKEAIAKGWDCPRAAVLLIFRKLQSNEFAIQTLGRILRMPEQKYYMNPLLNKGYVYTNISKDRIQVAGESEDYWKSNLITSTRRENLKNIRLSSVYEEYPGADRNRLGSDFKLFLYEYIKRHWFQGGLQGALFSIDEEGNMLIPDSEGTFSGFSEDTESNRRMAEAKYKIRFDVKGVTICIPKDLNINRIDEEGEIKIKDSVEYSRSRDKIYKIFVDYCRSLLTKFEKAPGTPILMEAIFYSMDEIFGLSEWVTPQVILSVKPVNNNAKFTDLFTGALDEYYLKLQEQKAKLKERSFKRWNWEVPQIRFYNSDKNEEQAEVDNHALMPYVRSNRNLIQERNFVKFLEENSDSIYWWYKNGDTGRTNYAIEYDHPQNGKSLFYVDFIIKLKNDDIYLFDTKGDAQSGDMEADDVLVAKHNALNKYVRESLNPKLKAGAIIKHYNGSWRYSPLPISSVDVTGWKPFFPDQLT